MSREFHGLDRLRLDKYLLLIRCYVGVGFQLFLKSELNNDNDNDRAGSKRKRDEKGEKEEQVGSSNGDNKKQKKNKKESTSINDQDKDQGNHDASVGQDDNDKKQKWTNLDSYLSILEEGPLCPLNFDPDQEQKQKEKQKQNEQYSKNGINVDSDSSSILMPHGPDGLRYHILDLWIDEIEKVLEFEEDGADDSDDGGGGIEENQDGDKRRRIPKGNVPVDLLLRPVEKLRTESPYKPVRTRAAETLDDERLVEWGFRHIRKSEDEDEDEEEEDEEWGGFEDD